MLPHHCFVYFIVFFTLHVMTKDTYALRTSLLHQIIVYCVLRTLAYWFTPCSESEYKIKLN